MEYLMKNTITNIKRYLIVFLASLLALISFNIKPIHGEDITYVEAPWVYKIENNVVAIIGYVGSDEECVVPWTLGGLEVKIVRKIHNENVKKVVIPNNDVEVESEVSDNYEVSYYKINDEGQNEIVDPNKTGSGNPIANFFSNLFGSKNKEDKTNNDAATNNNNNTDSQTTNNNAIGDPFNNLGSDNSNDNVANNNDINNILNNDIQTEVNDSKSSNGGLTIIIILILVAIGVVVYFFSKKQGDGLNTSRFVREFKRKIRRFFNKFK